MLRRLALIVATIALGASSAAAEPCANPGALGVARTLVVNPHLWPAVGAENYHVTLPLRSGEVVLTFDDGPRPPFTNRVLRALSDECTRATFFVLGRQARVHPELVQWLRAAGHSVGTHTQNHPLHSMTLPQAQSEIEGGIRSVEAALGTRPAPFFRFPGLYRTAAAERYLRARGIMVWSADVDSNDYRHIEPRAMLSRTLAQLERRRGGILLMHDIQPKTAMMLPTLLRELKARGFRVVHVVPGWSAPGLIARASADERDDTALAAPKRRRHARSDMAVAKPMTFSDAFVADR